MATSKLTPQDLLLVVTTIRVTIHTMGKFFQGDTRSGNHASIYLLIANSNKSVRLNMIKAGATDVNGTFEYEKYEYQDSNSSVHDFDMQAIRGLTVDNVLSLVKGNGRDKYRLARSGVGCRFWV